MGALKLVGATLPIKKKNRFFITMDNLKLITVFFLVKIKIFDQINSCCYTLNYE